MAAKNSPNAESNGGFKTVAFGFDKNDVNMYIAGLRKKMKTMEEEFEQKLSSALENPAASNDALKHEREVIRAETEKLWGEKLNERNQILKQQQVRINELEDELRVQTEKVASLRTQLAAATSDNNSDGVISARAAKAYMQFTRELRFISSSVEKTLEKMEQQWRGEFGETAKAEAAEEDTAVRSQENASVTAQTQFAEVQNESADNIVISDIASPDDDGYTVDIAPERDVKPAEAVMDIDADLLAEPLPEVPAPPKPAPEAAPKKAEKAKIREKKPGAAAKPSAETAPIAAPKSAAKPDTEADGEMTGKSAAKRISMPDHTPAVKAAADPVIEEVDFDLLLDKPKEQPVPEAAVADDFDSLLAEDSMSDDGLDLSPAAPVHRSNTAAAAQPSAPKKAEKAKTKIEVDDDLSALLADDLSDLLVTPADNTVKADEDFEKLLTEPAPEPDYGEDIFVTEESAKPSKGDDLDATFLSDIVINPGEIKDDLGDMLVAQEKADEEAFKDMFVTAVDDSDRNDGLGIDVGNIDFGMDSADDLANKSKTSKASKKDDDLFDFSFLAAESDDEDDMSTDVSFPGML